MNKLTGDKFVSLGLAHARMTNGNLSPTISQKHTSPFVWILSSNISPQPANKIGLWYDNAVWTDTNIWYD